MKNLYDELRTGRFYHRFETAVCVALSIAIAVVILISLIRLAVTIGGIIIKTEDVMNYESFRLIFGMIMTVLVALEFGNSVVRAIQTPNVVVLVDGIVLIGILTIVRKLILLEISDVSAWELGGMAAVLAALALLYWVLRQSRSNTTGSG
jgi:uncharacterized membrane protein (DUF373 family)